jgi:outer membrane protein, heavy metal efflux system
VRRCLVFALPAVAAAALAMAPTVNAQQRGITFDEAIALSGASPGARAALRALEARQTHDPRIGGTAGGVTVVAMPGIRWTPEEERGFEGQFSVTQSWSLAGLGAARRRAAAEERRVLATEARADALRVRLEAARRWIELNTLERLVGSTKGQLELARATLALMRRASEVGARTLVDVAEAEAFVAGVQEALLSVEGQAHVAALELAVSMGGQADASVRTRGALPHPQLPDATFIDAQAARVAELPRVAAIRLASLAARAREVEAKAAGGPLLLVGGQVQNEPPAAWTAMGTVGLTIAPRGTVMRARSEHLAQAERLEQEHAQAVLRAGGELKSAAHEVLHTRREAMLLEEQALPTAQTLVDRRERALSAGEGTTFELMEARRRLLEVQARLARALGARAWAEVRLWLLLAELERGTGSP